MTGGRETSLALENPSQIPLSALFLWRPRPGPPPGGGEGAAAWGITEPAVRLLWPGLMEAWSSARSMWAMRLAIATIRAVCGAFCRWPRGGWQKWVGPRRSSRSHEDEGGAAGALINQADRQRADMKLGLPVAQGAGAAALDLARAGEPFVQLRPGQGRAWGLHGRSPRRAGESFSRLERSSPNPPRPFPLLVPALTDGHRRPLKAAAGWRSPRQRSQPVRAETAPGWGEKGAGSAPPHKRGRKSAARAPREGDARIIAAKNMSGIQAVAAWRLAGFEGIGRARWG